MDYLNEVDDDLMAEGSAGNGNESAGGGNKSAGGGKEAYWQLAVLVGSRRWIAGVF